MLVAPDNLEQNVRQRKVLGYSVFAPIIFNIRVTLLITAELMIVIKPISL